VKPVVEVAGAELDEEEDDDDDDDDAAAAAGDDEEKEEEEEEEEEDGDDKNADADGETPMPGLAPEELDDRGSSSDITLDDLPVSL
jgi:hypothetical protein